jgi:hypothetical protein
MKVLLLTLFISLNVSASMTEELMRPTGAKLTKARFNAVIRIMETEFQGLAAESGRKLEFLTDYDEDWAQAFARRWETDQVIVYGGASGLNGGSEDSFALILCHEVGHLYGGTPYSDEHNKLAVEGQADFWSTRECFKRIALKLTAKVPLEASLKFCNADVVCARTIEAALVVTAFYADNRSLVHPKLDTPDVTTAEATNRTHPLPQCRLDTLKAGLEFLSRPLCWYKP